MDVLFAALNQNQNSTTHHSHEFQNTSSNFCFEANEVDDGLPVASRCVEDHTAANNLEGSGTLVKSIRILLTRSRFLERFQIPMNTCASSFFSYSHVAIFTDPQAAPSGNEDSGATKTRIGAQLLCDSWL